MGIYIAGFICALVLAALVIAWITYCMFIREKHKSEVFQYNISDIQHRNYVLAEQEQEKGVTKEVTAGIFILPSRLGHNEDYDKRRPDYPESPVAMQPSTERLVEYFNDCTADTDLHKDTIYEVDSRPCHSDV